MLKNYKELNVWQKSYALCLHIYKITKGFPKDEIYGLTSQTMISGDLRYVEEESLGKLKGEIGEIERMLKALIKSLESKHSDP